MRLPLRVGYDLYNDRTMFSLALLKIALKKFPDSADAKVRII